MADGHGLSVSFRKALEEPNRNPTERCPASTTLIRSLCCCLTAIARKGNTRETSAILAKRSDAGLLMVCGRARGRRGRLQPWVGWLVLGTNWRHSQRRLGRCGERRQKQRRRKRIGWGERAGLRRCGWEHVCHGPRWNDRDWRRNWWYRRLGRRQRELCHRWNISGRIVGIGRRAERRRFRLGRHGNRRRARDWRPRFRRQERGRAA